MGNTASRPETFQERVERLPSVLESYAKDISRTGCVPDSGLGEVLSVAASILRNLRTEVAAMTFQVTEAFQKSGLESETRRNNLLYRDLETFRADLAAERKRREEAEADLSTAREALRVMGLNLRWIAEEANVGEGNDSRIMANSAAEALSHPSVVKAMKEVER